jgi:hypothetical protein
VCLWPVCGGFDFVQLHGSGHPVQLVVLPYNYPRLFFLLNELKTVRVFETAIEGFWLISISRFSFSNQKTHRMVPSPRWRADFDAYAQVRIHFPSLHSKQHPFNVVCSRHHHRTHTHRYIVAAVVLHAAAAHSPQTHRRELRAGALGRPAAASCTHENADTHIDEDDIVRDVDLDCERFCRIS